MAVAARAIDPKQLAGRYLVALISTLGALWLRSTLHPWLKDECPFSLFYLSVLLTAWLAGTGPAVLAMILGTASAAFFFIEPRISLRVDSLSEIIQLGIYVVVNVVATWLFERSKRQRLLAEQRALENSRLSDSLRKADERKDEYLALLAHELRNPLAPIRSGLVVLERESTAPSEVQRVRRIMQRQVDHLVRLTQDLLDVSRITRGKIVLQQEPIALQQVVDDALEMVGGEIEQRRHQFQRLLPDEPVRVRGDRVRLTQLVANLLSNAAKYTPDSGRIVLELESHAGFADLSVRDNGIGFSSEQSERIFQPFTQVDPSRTREQGGLGLGLAIVRHLAELHDGSVAAHSRGPGLGAVFTARLPVLPSTTDERSRGTACDEAIDAPREMDSAMSPATADAPAVPSAAATSAPRRILLVEDNPDAAALLAELLRGDGYVVLTANDGLAALQVAVEHEPDVCLLDIGLPGMDGYEVARRIRRTARGKAMRLIAVTGWGTVADRTAAMQAGFDRHLVKPVSYTDLVEVIRSPRDVSSTARHEAVV